MALSTLQARTGAMIAGTRLQSARSLRAALPAVRGAALGARKQRRAHAGVVRAALIQSDIERERSRSFRRTVFNKKEWMSHRSVSRYFRHMDGILTSRIVRGLLPPLVCVLLSSYLVCTYEELWEEGTLDEWVPWFPWPDLAVSPEGPFSISTFALSLLLVFRTNSSYDRWWEACSAWNTVVASACHLARQACQWLPSGAPEDERIRLALLRWLTAFPLALKTYVREETQERLPMLVENVLLPEERELLLSSAVPPQTALSMIGSLLSTSRMTIDSKTHMDESVRQLQSSFQCCEKILRTPLPLSYTRHTSRFLVTWLTFLPFCAWKELGWATVPVDVILGFFLLGIEEIGVQTEEPLGVIALEHWCEVVEERIQQISQEHAAVQAVQALVISGASSTAVAAAAHATLPAHDAHGLAAAAGGEAAGKVLVKQ